MTLNLTTEELYALSDLVADHITEMKTIGFANAPGAADLASALEKFGRALEVSKAVEEQESCR